MEITQITYTENDDGRLLKIQLDNGTIVRAAACHESWEQWCGNVEELCTTQPIVEAHNDWLHGGELPFK